MAAPFYSQADQAIYQSGDKFIPQEQYRLNYAPLGGTLPPSIANASTGITGTQAANPYIWPPQGEGGGNIPVGPNISDFQTTIEARQKRLQDPNKISQLLGNFLPQQRSAQDMLASGEKDVRAMEGIPFGIGAMISRALPDKYYDMPRGDQAFIQSQMGYSDPNTNQGNQDPFGVNVRSAFGNYADFVVDEADKLEGIVADQKRRGLTNTLQMKKLRYYKPLRMQRQNIQSDAALIDKASPAGQVRQNIQTYGSGDRPNTGLNEPGGGKGQSPTGGDVAGTPFAQGGRIGYRWGESVDPEEPAEDIREIMQDQNIPFGEQVEEGITEEQKAMVLDMLEREMDIPTIISITGVSEADIMSLMGGTSMAPDSEDQGLASIV